jgi:vanillate/4-hydroxybenzoate decarboxylase subunit D
VNDSTANSTICPRCDAENVRVLTTSPIPGRWTMYVCNTCIYSWRSTEARSATDPLAYPAEFKLDPRDIPSIPAIPTVPPRRR